MSVGFSSEFSSTSLCSLLVKRDLLTDSLFRLCNWAVVSGVEVEDETIVEDTVISVSKAYGVVGCTVVSSETLEIKRSFVFKLFFLVPNRR